MPIFEYKCPKCTIVFETFVLHQDDKARCPKCGGDQVTKLMSAPNVGVSGSHDSCAKNCEGKKGFG